MERVTNLNSLDPECQGGCWILKKEKARLTIVNHQRIFFEQEKDTHERGRGRQVFTSSSKEINSVKEGGLQGKRHHTGCPDRGA